MRTNSTWLAFAFSSRSILLRWDWLDDERTLGRPPLSKSKIATFACFDHCRTSILFVLVMSTLYHTPWTYDVHLKTYLKRISQSISGEKMFFAFNCGPLTQIHQIERGPAWPAF